MTDTVQHPIAKQMRDTIKMIGDDRAAYSEELGRLHEALRPSAETKAAYIGEFTFLIEDRDEDGEECSRKITVPWTTVKEIMAAIKARAERK